VNPLYLIVMAIVTWGCFTSLRNWKRGLLWFFLYLQFAGFLKRLIYGLAPIANFQYNLLVGSQLIWFLCCCAGALLVLPPPRLTKWSRVWLVVFGLQFLVSVTISFLPATACLTVGLLQYTPLLGLLIGQRIDNALLNRFYSLLVNTLPFHLAHQVYQFIWGPFGFERKFMLERSSLAAFNAGDFTRYIPLYDSAEPLTIHLAIAAIVLAGRRGSLPKLLVTGILTAALMSGMRSVFSAVSLALFFRWLICSTMRRRWKWTFVLGTSTFSALFLTIFSAQLARIIDYAVDMDLKPSTSAFIARLGTIGTYSDRVLGRMNAFEHLSLFGHGYGASRVTAGVLKNKGFDEATGSASETFAHDLIGEWVLDFGLIGLIMLVYLFVHTLFPIVTRTQYAVPSAVVLGMFNTAVLLGSQLIFGRSGFFVFLLMGYLIAQRAVPEAITSPEEGAPIWPE